MKKFDSLVIISNENPDWCGHWRRSDVFAEISDLGYDTRKVGAWNWVLDHVFDSLSGDIPDHDVIATQLENGVIEEIMLNLPEGSVKIKQY